MHTDYAPFVPYKNPRSIPRRVGSTRYSRRSLAAQAIDAALQEQHFTRPRPHERSRQQGRLRCRKEVLVPSYLVRPDLGSGCWGFYPPLHQQLGTHADADATSQRPWNAGRRTRTPGLTLALIYHGTLRESYYCSSQLFESPQTTCHKGLSSSSPASGKPPNATPKRERALERVRGSFAASQRQARCACEQ